MSQSEGKREFGNTWESVSNEIAPSTSIYADLDVVGGLLTFPDVIQSDIGGGIIVDAVLYDTSSVSAPLELMLFSSPLSTGTVTSATGDNGALVLADTDLPKICGAITFSTGGVQHLFADNAVHFADTDLPKAFYATSRNLYGVLLSRGTPTYSCGNIMGVKLIVARDSK
jgi:hypothetical protein